MLASINPLGERARNQHYAITVGAFVASATVAAAALGFTLGALGRPLARPSLAIPLVAVGAAIGLVLDARGRVPGPRRQVDENWLTTYRGWVYGAGFGAQLGAGFATIVTASATWLAFACAFLSGSAVAGAAIGTVFGLVRALPVLATARVRDPAALRACVRRIDRGRVPMMRTTTAVQSAAVVICGAVLAGARW